MPGSIIDKNGFCKLKHKLHSVTGRMEVRKLREEKFG